MDVTIVLGISVLLQFLAAILALRLIWMTEKKMAWILIAGAILLMAIRRSITITRLISGDISYPPDLTAEVVALIISALMVAGIAFIAPLFHAIKKSEEDFHASEKRYRKLIETANDAIFLADPESGIIIDANKQAEKLLGMPAKKIIGMHQTQLHPKEESEYYGKIFKDYIELDKTITETLFVIHKDGHSIPVEISSSVFESGGRKFILGIFRNISEREETNKFLQQRLLQQEIVADLGQFALAGTDLNTLLETAVTKTAHVLKVEYTKVLELLPEGNAFLLRAGVGWKEGLVGSATVGAGADSQAGYTLMSKEPVIVADLRTDTRFSGPPLLHDHEVLSGMSVIIAGYDRPFGILGVHTTKRRTFTRDDINFVQSVANVLAEVIERKASYEKLHREKELISNIISSSLDGILAFDCECRYTLWNQGMERITGVKKEDLIGKCAFDVFPFLKEIGEDKSFHDALKGKSTISKNRQFYISQSGREGFFDSYRSPLYNEKGEIIGGLAIIRETTELKKLEEELLQSQKMEAVGQLAGGIAHDFNNILTAIMGYSNILQMKMDEGDDSLRSYVDAIIISSKRAAALTRGLLSFSRKQIMNPVLINLNDIVSGSEGLVSRTICEDIKFTVRLTDKDLPIMADSAQIEQVLMNLVTNACHVMLKGGELTIRTEIMEMDDSFVKHYGYGAPGMYAFMSFTDTGTGMDEETRNRIFEPFFTTKEVGKGTGLGLAIIYGIIKQHNGYINVYSEVDIGTTFKIYLPLIGEKIKPDKWAEAPVTGGTETVLVAEDDEAVRSSLKLILQEYGYTVIEAGDGTEAIEKFIENEEKIQLLLLDVVMPGKKGKEVYEEIKKMRPDIKTIFTSGYTEDIIHTKDIIEQDLNFVSKPISPNNLLRKAREVLDN